MELNKSEHEKENVPQSSGSKDDKFRKTIYEFDRINERVTYYFCSPIIDNLDFVDYCSLAKMPGVWLSSKKREERTEENKSEEKTKEYDPKKHIVKNCLRQLLRKEYEHAFGECIYSMTDYGNILRVTRPYEKNFLIILNLQPKIRSEFEQLQEFYCKVIQTMEQLKDLCNRKLQLFNNGEITSDEMLADFFSKIPKHVPELRRSLQDVTFDERVHCISIGTVDGIPLERLVLTEESSLLDDFDEIEYFIETAAGIKMRNMFSLRFDGVKFNIVVYEEIVIMTIPIPNTDFFVLLALKMNKKNGDASYDEENDDEFFDKLYFPKSLKRAFLFIKKKLDADSIIAAL